MAWYCAFKLEMATALTAALLTEQLQSNDVPGRGDAQQKIEAQLRSRMGCDISVADIPELRHFGQVDDSYTTFEWSDGGIIHVHMAVWTVHLLLGQFVLHLRTWLCSCVLVRSIIGHCCCCQRRCRQILAQGDFAALRLPRWCLDYAR